LRCNSLRTDRQTLRDRFAKAGIEAEPGETPHSLRLAQPANVRDLPGYADGWFSVQDESAQQAALALAPEPGWQVLDLCAAPGGKTTYLAALMANQGRIVACDVDDRRLQTITEWSHRLAVTIIEPSRLHPVRHAVPRGRPV